MRCELHSDVILSDVFSLPNGPVLDPTILSGLPSSRLLNRDIRIRNPPQAAVDRLLANPATRSALERAKADMAAAASKVGATLDLTSSNQLSTSRTAIVLCSNERVARQACHRHRPPPPNYHLAELFSCCLVPYAQQ